ncbi:hypothetical protein ACFOLG_08375 [Vogesella facilis]|uniref:Ubiquinone biosynthesis accessory factor UbiT n=1 Tax=Vogesella facilis TaxID=1655232 RepID=A0ABV7RF18_9NEIS
MSAAPGWRQRWQTLHASLPSLHRDGIALPVALLLPRLQAAIDSAELSVQDLRFTPQGGELHLLLKKPGLRLLRIQFRFAPVDWAQRRIDIDFTLQGENRDATLAGRALGKLLQLGLESGLGLRALQRLAAPLEWLLLQDGRASVLLDKLPTVARWLQQPLLGKPLAERLCIAAIDTTDDALRLRIARIKPQDQG